MGQYLGSLRIFEQPPLSNSDASNASDTVIMGDGTQSVSSGDTANVLEGELEEEELQEKEKEEKLEKGERRSDIIC